MKAKLSRKLLIMFFMICITVIVAVTSISATFAVWTFANDKAKITIQTGSWQNATNIDIEKTETK